MLHVPAPRSLALSLSTLYISCLYINAKQTYYNAHAYTGSSRSATENNL